MTTNCAEHRSIFDLTPNDEALAGLREVNSLLKQPEPASEDLEDKSPEDDRQRESSLVREVSDKMFCSACKCSFSNREEQIEHYKLDWHRFNLRLKMSGLPAVTAEEFERKTGAGDMSSISGSESDSEEGDSDSEGGGTIGRVSGTDNESQVESSLISGRSSSKVVFQNSAGQYLAVHRCILQGKPDDEQDAGSALKAISKSTVWVIIMTGGGHFAAAVFQGKEVLQHKTFHRYTVRAKRGTAQGLRDSQNRSHTPKSAGAALRRHNEAALVKDIQDLLASWAEHLKQASAVFVRAPSYNKGIFFGGRAAPLDKKDPRIRTLPFATRRATFREVQRVHDMLSTVHVYGKDTDVSAVFSPSKKPWKKAVKPVAEAIADTEKPSAEEQHHNASDKEEGGEIQLEMVELTLGTLDLRESEICPSRQRRRRRKKKEDAKMQNEEASNMEADSQEEEAQEAEPAGGAPQETQTKRRRRKAPSKKDQEDVADESWEYGLRDALFTGCKVGDVDAVCGLLRPPAEAAERPEGEQRDPLSLLNKPIDSSGFTLLHVASAAAQKAVVRLLLDEGADPASRDKKGQTPYIVAPDKDTRNVFRKYMGEHPDKYDYSKAQVPGPLTAEIEAKQSEKKKAQKALKKQREKEQKEEKKKQEQEAEEKKRFASLTDREKRALAAERRLAEQAATTGVAVSNIKRCWLCGESLLGKIPFQYLEFSFCSTRCVQAHRKANAVPGKS